MLEHWRVLFWCICGASVFSFNLAQGTTAECDVNDPYSCDTSKLEVCRFSSGTYRCQCPPGYSRLSSGKCNLRNECEDSTLNDCHSQAQCIDLSDGYTCKCKSGYVDISVEKSRKPGRICKRLVNECSSPTQYSVDCDENNAICVNTEEAFTCTCLPGFVDISENYNLLPGRKCIEAVNECLNPGLNECSPNAECEDAKEGYICSCQEGYIDASPNITHYPGRVCNKPDQTGEVAVLWDLYSLKNKLFSSCASANDCHSDAICSDVFGGYKCQCRPGWVDISDDPYKYPGRKCQQLINECATSRLNNCSPYATCTDTSLSYKCSCKDNYIDVSSQYNAAPGTHCVSISNECQDARYHSCDENANCVDLTDGYTCQCAEGFIDVSSSANLDPGRVCTLSTYCPSQPTDLMFLVDGSGSIGSDTFSSEVLRFVREFVDLFDISPTKTQVAMIQYSDRIQHEFDFNDYTSKSRLLQAISQVKYLSGMTQTGNAMQYMTDEGFSLPRGARPRSSSIARIAIVITDGRSQDKVRTAAERARSSGIKIFAIGVTDHVYDTELEEIAGSSKRYFKVQQFSELDVRLRSIIQKEACIPVTPPPPPPTCNTNTHEGCNRGLNEICVKKRKRKVCVCPDGFSRNPVTKACGVLDGESLVECFPDQPSSCGDNEVCARDTDGRFRCMCKGDLERNPRTGKCMIGGSCDPTEVQPCDVRKKEECLPHSSGTYYTCQCPPNYRRHSQTGVCLIDECATGQNDCHHAARCYVDTSFDITKPGRICTKKVNECSLGTHNCSENANCIDTDLGFLCRCKDGYVDFSPNPRQFAGVICKELVDECQLGQHDCHENADCLDTLESYICVCKAGFIDLNFLRNPGRQCVQNECNAGSHDCSTHAQCIDTEGSYTCRCLDGYFDTDPSNPGRTCVLIINECVASSLNDCSPNAVCSDTIDGYTCECKDGFIDMSPNQNKYPGRLCRSNQCSSSKYNDCSDNADCQDTGDSYVCTCKSGYTDYSPTGRPGRICLLNECLSGSHDCDVNANCIDQRNGYTCQCKTGYYDLTPSNPGRSCSQVINECASSSSNDCSPYAECTDLLLGYTCECKYGFKDVSQNKETKPGRICESDFCSNRNTHDCSKFATCTNTEDSYTCECKEGYEDAYESTLPGRYCITAAATTTTTTTSPGIPCNGGYCLLDLNEVCIDGKCGCPNGQKRNSDQDTCEDVDAIVLPLHVVRRNKTTIYYNSAYADSTNPRYIEIVDIFNRGIENAMLLTRLGKYFVTTDVNYITQPKTYNSSWDYGLMFNFTIYTKKGTVELEDCYYNLIGSIERTNYSIGNTELYINPYQLKPPFNKTGPTGQKCSEDLVCNADLGEVCIAKKVCGCPNGMGRSSNEDKCIYVEGFVLPLWVLRYEDEDLEYNTSFTSPLTIPYKLYVKRFKGGIVEAYSPTIVWPHFVYTEVNDIQDPSEFNSTWDSGILYNFTVYFRKGQIQNPEDVWTQLIYQIRNNNYEIGNSDLFTSSYQENPFSPCYENDCHPRAWCIPGVRKYTCQCPPNYRDLDPSNPGRKCRSKYGYNECANEEDNECDPVNARCIDEYHLYRCECIPGYIDASPAGSVKGSLCTLDYCSDLEATCLSSNATCINLENRGICVCKEGYMDIRSSPVLAQYGLKGAICIKITDVNECDLQLTNCSRVAICTDLEIGYTCACPPGFPDGDVSEPGRICPEAVIQCALCNGNGNCVYDRESGNTTCECYADWMGPYCAQSRKKVAVLYTALPIILAILFFLLMLLCLLFLCRYCRCIKGAKGAGIFGAGGGYGGEGGMSSLNGSDYYKSLAIPRPRLMRPDYDRYSESGSSVSESEYGTEVDRRVVTEVKKTTMTRTLQGAEAADALSSGAGAAGGVTTTTEVVTRKGGGGAAGETTQVKMFGQGDTRQSMASYTQDRGVSEYIESDYEGVSDEESRSTQSSEAGDSVYDKTVTVNRSKGWFPDADGRGGKEKYKTEVNTKSMMTGTSRYD